MRGTVLVTGASGFLGGRAVREFRDHDWEVVAAGRRAEALPAGIRAFVGDLEALATARIPVDAVVHCAALSTPWGRWRDFERANVQGTMRAMEFAKRNGAKRLVFVSSPSVYATAADRIGIVEDDVDPGNRLNGYIRSKIAAERALLQASAEPGAPEVVIVRPRGLIGRGDPSLVPRLLAARDRVGIPIVGGGRNLVDLTSVENAARALRLAVETPGVGGEVFNITNGDPRAFGALAERLLAEVGLEPRFLRVDARIAYALAAVLEGVCRALPGMPEPPVTRYTVTTIAYSQTLDIAKARRLLGYAPSVTIDESLREYRDA